MYSHLLVPIDDTDLSVEVIGNAVALARPLGARITFFHAVADAAGSLRSDAELLRLTAPDEYDYAYLGKARELLAKAEAAARALGVPCECRHAVSDKPAQAIVEAARADCQLGLDDLVNYGMATVVGPAQLRFQLDETIELVRARFGQRVDRDAAARLHELAEGWPLGLQLALSVMSAGADPQAEILAMAERGGSLRETFVSLLLANLDPADVGFLTRISILDHLHASLCGLVAGAADAAERLVRLARDTPVFATGESSDWLRMHALARDELRRRFALLPAEEQAQLHARAGEALAARGMLDAAARHALAAGQREAAYDLAERSLYESLMARVLHTNEN